MLATQSVILFGKMIVGEVCIIASDYIIYAARTKYTIVGFDEAMRLAKTEDVSHYISYLSDNL